MPEKDFEAALERLKTIVSRLEAGDIRLEEALQLFEEGVGLSQFCSQKLEEAERRIEVLVRGRDGEDVEAPFQGDEEQGDDVV